MQVWTENCLNGWKQWRALSETQKKTKDFLINLQSESTASSPHPFGKVGYDAIWDTGDFR